MISQRNFVNIRMDKIYLISSLTPGDKYNLLSNSVKSLFCFVRNIEGKKIKTGTVNVMMLHINPLFLYHIIKDKIYLKLDKNNGY